MTPKVLNGYPVYHREDHRNGYFTIMVQKGEDEFVVATWWSDLKTQWMWGHYSFSHADAVEDFKEAAARNSKRSRIALTEGQSA